VVELARAHAGCFGRAGIGAGFGGATVILVAITPPEPFRRNMAQSYEAKTGRKLKPFVCQIVDGAA